MITKKVTCVICPVGCEISVDMDENNKILTISGNKCKRGYKYASTEVINPERILTSTVVIESEKIKRLAVKSEKPISKTILADCMVLINNASVKTPVKMGDVIIKNILNSGVDIVASRTVIE